jgi:hypothetical protein
VLLEVAFNAHLSADAKVRELVSNEPFGENTTRIFPVFMQGARFPAVVYYKDSSPRDYTHDGASGAVTSIIHVLCMAKIYREVKELADAVRKAVSGFGPPEAGIPAMLGGADGIQIGGLFVDDDKDLPYAFDEEETLSCYVVLVVVRILHSEV